MAFAIALIMSNVLSLDSKSSHVISPFFLISEAIAEDGYTKWNPPEYKTTKGKEIYNQDGLSIIEYEDGRKVTTNDNERWDEKTEYPDGRIVTEYLDGPTVTKQPDGSIVTDNGYESYTDYPDGTRVREYTGAGSDDDVALKRVTERPDGTVTNEFSDGTRDDFNGFGKTSLTSEHGGMRETRNYPEGAWVKENADGTTVTKFPNGQTVTEWPDRTRITENSDGSRIVQNPDGTRAYDDPNTGKTSYENPIVTKTEDGGTITKYRDGTTVVEDAWGKTIATYPDGTKITESPDHENIPGLGRTISYPGGKTIDILDDGTKRIHFADGTQITEYPDGRVEKINPDGTLAEREDGNAVNEINELDNQYKETRSEIDRLKEEKKQCKSDDCRDKVQEEIKKAIAKAAKTLNKKSRLKKQERDKMQRESNEVSHDEGGEKKKQYGGIIGRMKDVLEDIQESSNSTGESGKTPADNGQENYASSPVAPQEGAATDVETEDPGSNSGSKGSIEPAVCGTGSTGSTGRSVDNGSDEDDGKGGVIINADPSAPLK